MCPKAALDGNGKERDGGGGAENEAVGRPRSKKRALLIYGTSFLQLQYATAPQGKLKSKTKTKVGWTKSKRRKEGRARSLKFKSAKHRSRSFR